MLWEMNGWLDKYVKNPTVDGQNNKAGKVGGGKGK